MRGAVLAVLLLVPATGCTGEEPTGAQDPPKLGGTLPTQSPPSAPMDELEQPVAERLQQQVAGQGLTVDALDCPEWGGDVPAELTCEGWFDGVPGTVVVNLSRDKKQSVSFDAVLQDGVIATKRLIDELVSDGYANVDCGAAPAYAAEPGATITCAVEKDGAKSFVRATVTDVEGGVTISGL